MSYIKYFEVDIIYCHELWLLESASTGKNEKSILVYDAHELEIGRYSWWPTAVKEFVVSIEEKYIHDADFVVTVSPGCAQSLENHYNIKKPFVVRNIPVPEAFLPCRTGLREMLDICKQSKIFVYTGNVAPGRGILNSLKSLQHLPSKYHFVCVGTINVDYKTELLNVAWDLGVNNRFHLIPKVKYEELVNLISEADYAIIPIENKGQSYYHCLPNKLFESAYAGLPVLTSDFPDMSHVVISSSIGIVASLQNDYDITLALIRLENLFPNKLDERTIDSFASKYSYELDFMKFYSCVRFNPGKSTANIASFL